MKRNILATTAVLATLIGLSQIARAADECHTFTPIDELPPQTRQDIGARLAEALKNIQVDWDAVVIGLDENGQIVLRAKLAGERPMGSYSCYGAQAKECVE